MNSIVISADVGHKNTKILGGLFSTKPSIFLSTSREHIENNISDENPVILQTESGLFDIGSKHGRYSLTDDKSEDEVFHNCLLTALGTALSDEYSQVNLVTGIPVNYYSKYKDKLNQVYLGQTVEFYINNLKKVVNFVSVDILPESVGAILVSSELRKGSSLVIDIGGRTVDVAYFEDAQLVKTSSYDLGVLSLYSSVSSSVNKKYGTDYSSEQGETILTSRLITIDNKDLTYDPTNLMLNHTQTIIDRVKLDYPWKTSKKRFIGGGSILLSEQIDSISQFKTTVTSDDIFTNARAYYSVGVSKYAR